MANKILSGVITALATPFKDGEVDFESLEKIISFQLECGVDGFVVNGTTGESPTLEWHEVEKIAQFVRKKAPGIKLVLGVGSNSTTKVIDMISSSSNWDVDALMVVVPYYNKPTQEGLYQHFKAAASATSRPIIVYNVPSRTVASIEVETLKRLSEVKNIVGIKEATGNLEVAKKIRDVMGPDYILLSGDDFTCVDFMKGPGDGVISVTSHLCTREIKTLLEKNDPAAEKRFNEINKLAFAISSPIPLKAMLFLKGLIASAELRLPLVQLDQDYIDELKTKMSAVGAL